MWCIAYGGGVESFSLLKSVALRFVVEAFFITLCGLYRKLYKLSSTNNEISQKE